MRANKDMDMKYITHFTKAFILLILFVIGIPNIFACE